MLMLCSLAAQWRTEARVGLGLQLGYLSAPAAHPRCAPACLRARLKGRARRMGGKGGGWEVAGGLERGCLLRAVPCHAAGDFVGGGIPDRAMCRRTNLFHRAKRRVCGWT